MVLVHQRTIRKPDRDLSYKQENKKPDQQDNQETGPAVERNWCRFARARSRYSSSASPGIRGSCTRYRLVR